MEPTPVPRVKVCCIQSVAEARAAVAMGAAALGLVSEMPSGPGVIPEERIAAIAAVVPPPVAPFLLTCRQDVPSLVAQQRRVAVGTLQLCDRLPAGAHAELRAALPGVRLVQVIHHVDGLLLDSGNPDLPVKQLGGTGRRHDWALSRRIREAVDVPVFLAGGLTADNAAEAVAAVGPFALDVCGGVRTSGRLDEARLRAFFRAVSSASG